MSELPEELPAGGFFGSMPWGGVLGGGRGEGGDSGGDSPRPRHPVLDADGRTGPALFTDEDLAQRFVDESGFDGGPLPVDTPAQFLGLVRRLPSICEYAAFDPPSRVGARARWVVTLAEVARALEAAHDDREGEALDN